MADERELKLAKTIYDQICKSLDDKSCEYEKNAEDNIVHFFVGGDDLTMEFVVCVDAERQLIRLISMLPFKFPEDKRLEGAIATCHINYALADGSFDYDITDGEVSFRLTSSYRDSLISPETFEYLIGLALVVVDEFNDKLLMVAKGFMGIDDFIKKYN